jgi:predicted small lipoprotein YifL
MTTCRQFGGRWRLAMLMLLLCALTACVKKPPVYVMDSSRPVLLKKGDPAPADGFWLSPGAMADLLLLDGS